MPQPVFPDKSLQPSSDDLRRVLGDSASLLQEIEDYLKNGQHGPGREWKFYSKAAGWTLAIKAKKRTVLHLLPREGSFIVVFTFGKRAVSAAEEVGLPQRMLTLIANAREYAEGRSFRFDVVSQSDLDCALKLVSVKLAN